MTAWSRTSTRRPWAAAPLSEHDLDQKVELRRAFWAMGASTRIDVKLSALISKQASRTRAGMEELTDLDVLGVQYAPMTGLTYAIADCKTTKGRIPERVFWLRGVADLFGARTAYLTRDVAPPGAARQLAIRLGISVLDPADRQALLGQVGDGGVPKEAAFLGRDALVKWTTLTTETPAAIERLQRYRRSVYWLVQRHRNLTQLPTHLSEAAGAFAPEQRWAHAVLADLAWLYLLTLASALDEMTRLQLAEPQGSLQQVVVGGEQELRERQRTATMLGEVLRQVDPVRAASLPAQPVLPPYFDELLDLLIRLGRRRDRITGALRALEFAGVETTAARGMRWIDAFPSEAIEGKIASDVVRFLVRACRLDPAFVPAFDAGIVAGASAPVAVAVSGVSVSRTRNATGSPRAEAVSGAGASAPRELASRAARSDVAGEASGSRDRQVGDAAGSDDARESAVPVSPPEAREGRPKRGIRIVTQPGLFAADAPEPAVAPNDNGGEPPKGDESGD